MVNHFNIEEQVTEGNQAQWIVKIIHDLLAHTLQIDLTHHPESPGHCQELHFTDVSGIDTVWQDRDDECMESILGIHIELGSGDVGTAYRLITEQREFVIKTSEKPMLARRRSKHST